MYVVQDNVFTYVVKGVAGFGTSRLSVANETCIYTMKDSHEDN
jgi:hypothetical protein